MNQSNSNHGHQQGNVKGITRISVSGYKSLYDECSIEVRPLTILAGANSSGKSSIMQPLLLMKQTLEATYDPGALLLNGPNVKFTSAAQLFSKFPGLKSNNTFTVGIEISRNQFISNIFTNHKKEGIDIVKMIYKGEEKEFSLLPNMLSEDILNILPKPYIEIYNAIQDTETLKDKTTWVVDRSRCFLEFSLSAKEKYNIISQNPLFNLLYSSPSEIFGNYIREIIHVPGLRGNPERNYKITAIGDEFPGTFENYVASVINHWQKGKSSKNIKELCSALETLRLTCKVHARQVNDTQVELRVGRLPTQSKSKDDMVNIADVGFGVSQTLPVLVALLAAEPGQLVYIEQPEIHLHPRAQVAMAEILANAAKRGVKVVIETHSDRLILAIQSLVAEGNLSPDLVKLHWFTRQEDGITRVNSADLDEAGAFGDWPEDFGDVSLQLENRYLSAAEARLMQGIHGE